jgi:hypothetical protein
MALPAWRRVTERRLRAQVTPISRSTASALKDKTLTPPALATSLSVGEAAALPTGLLQCCKLMCCKRHPAATSCSRKPSVRPSTLTRQRSVRHADTLTDGCRLLARVAERAPAPLVVSLLLPSLEQTTSGTRLPSCNLSPIGARPNSCSICESVQAISGPESCSVDSCQRFGRSADAGACCWWVWLVACRCCAVMSAPLKGPTHCCSCKLVRCGQPCSTARTPTGKGKGTACVSPKDQ